MLDYLNTSKESISQIVEFIASNEYLLPDPFSAHIDIPTYAEKLNQQGVTIVARNAGKIVGLISGYCNDFINRWAFVQVIIVEKEAQGNGIGASLLLEFIKNAQLLFNHGTVFLTVDLCNQKAIAFYGKMGFTKSVLKTHINQSKQILEYNF